MKAKKLVLNIVASAFAVFTISGCSALQETMKSQMEVPSLENQATRVAVGMAIVRENAIIENLEISSDASWPAVVAADINEETKKFINNAVKRDPYFATAHYTKSIQRKMLGSGAGMSALLGDNANLVASALNQAVSPLTYEAMNKLDVFYANPDLMAREAYGTEEEYINARTKNWPDIFSFESTSNYMQFNGGVLAMIESPKGDVYPNINRAVLALAPVGLAKDLENAQDEYIQGLSEVEDLKADLGGLKSQLESGKDGEEDLTEEEKSTLQEEIATKEEEIKSAESITDEKEAIYFTKLDEMAIAIEGSVNTEDKNYMNLAKNINIVANELQQSSAEAYTAFGLALTNIVANNTLLKLPKELESLAYAKAFVPANLQTKYDERVARIVKNALLILPNVFVGTYYANKQSSRAAKYEDITAKILEVFATQMEQAAAEKQAADEEAN